MAKCGCELIFQETCFFFVSQICEPREVQKTQRECCCSTGRHEERRRRSSRSGSRVMWGGGYIRCGSNNLWEDGAGRKWPWRVPIQTKVSRFLQSHCNVVCSYMFLIFTTVLSMFWYFVIFSHPEIFSILLLTLYFKIFVDVL